MADIEYLTDGKKSNARKFKKEKKTQENSIVIANRRKTKKTMTMTMKKRKKAQPSTSRRLRLYIAKHISAQPIETFILDTNDATERKNPPEIWTVSLF